MMTAGRAIDKGTANPAIKAPIRITAIKRARKTRSSFCSGGLNNFIEEKSDSNSIFILLGDHQPPTLEYKIWNAGIDDATTPIHIIGRDSLFIRSFEEHGLQAGMNIDLSKSEVLKHQGIYSLFFRQLIKQYGEKGTELPQYFPNGLE